MAGYSVKFRKGVIGTEATTLIVPRKIKPNQRAIIYAHGANGDAKEILNYTSHSTGLVKFFGQFARAGYVIFASDFGGLQTYGNDTALTAMEAGWTWLQNSGLCATDKVILTGGSMGSLSCHRFAFAHPTQVAGMNLWIPAIDVEQARQNNPSGLRDLINTAWGLPAGSYTALDGTTVPARGNVLTRATEANGIKTHLWYSSGDTVTPGDAVTRYVTARNDPNVTAHLVSTVTDHGNPSISLADPDAALNFFNSIA